jgi:uncharacterized Tic20 family protein
MTAVPPAGGVSSDDKTWGLIAWGAAYFFPIIGPLVVMLTKGKESPFVRANSVEALNFGIVITIAYVVGFILTIILVGILIVLAAAIVHIIFCIMGAIKAYAGEEYRCPVNIRMVK